MDGSDLFVMESKYIETHDMHARLLVLYIHTYVKRGGPGLKKRWSKVCTWINDMSLSSRQACKCNNVIKVNLIIPGCIMQQYIAYGSGS